MDRCSSSAARICWTERRSTISSPISPTWIAILRRGADYALRVDFPHGLEEKIAPDKREALRGLLSGDPRPSYQNDPKRVYGVRYADYDVRFIVKDGTLTVVDIIFE